MADVGYRIGPVENPDQYVIGQPVGSGAEGILYRGSLTTPAGVQLEVAVKMLQPRLGDHIDEWLPRWREQLELLRSLQIPGVVPVRDGFEGPPPHLAGEQPPSGRSLYLVMNWVDGQPLNEWVWHNRDCDIFDTLRLLLPVATALDVMHGGQLTGGVPVVHRDVKPANIIINSGGSTLVDFGLVRGFSAQVDGIVGTPGYMAPEVLAGEPPTPASDRYGLAATAYYALTGVDPPEASESRRMREALAGSRTLTGRYDVADQILVGLHADPEQRPLVASNWIAQIEQSTLVGIDAAASTFPPQPAPSTESTRPAPPIVQPAAQSEPARPGPKRSSFVTLVVVAVVAAAAALWLVGRGNGSDTTSVDDGAEQGVANPGTADEEGPEAEVVDGGPESSSTSEAPIVIPPLPTFVRDDDGVPVEEVVFSGTNALAVDRLGRVYVTVGGWSDGRIRMVDEDGTVGTVAGDGSPGFAGDTGPATVAQLSFPRGIALGVDGRLYVADSGNDRIRLIDLDGTITTLVSGLNDPRGLVSADDGSLYIAESGGHRVLLVQPTGDVGVVAGIGTRGSFQDGELAIEAELNAPNGVARSTDGSLVIADTGNNCIVSVDSSGVMRLIAGVCGTSGFSGDSGPAHLALLRSPTSVAVAADGAILIADQGNNRIRRVDPDGTITTIAGGGGDDPGNFGLASNAVIRSPRGLAAVEGGGIYFVSDRGLRHIDSSGIITTITRS